jgi:hypothetical protein
VRESAAGTSPPSRSAHWIKADAVAYCWEQG